jgi:2-iminobutanoate/2-iminopropanoate deaminase
MLNKLNPPSICAPLGAYTHGIEITPGARVVHVSGQVGMRPDGRVAEGIEAQLRCAWDERRTSRFIRGFARSICDARPSATAVCVSALAAPEFLCEIEAIAAKA